MTELTCGIVRDLLPSYIDGLSCQETNEAVDAHLENCGECRHVLDTMRVPENKGSADESMRDVQYLKKIKKRGKLRVISAVLATLCVLAIVTVLKLCVLGSSADPSMLRYTSTVNEDASAVCVTMSPIGGETRLIGEKVSVDNEGNATVSVNKAYYLFGARADRQPCKVLVPLSASSGGTQLSSIKIGDRLIWQDGISISEKATELYAARTPYIGNAPAISRIANLLGITNVCGNYQMSLQTASEPYGMTIEFTDPCDNPQTLDTNMEKFSCVLIALVDNLDSVSWTYTDSDGAGYEQTVSSGDYTVSALNLKNSGKSELNLQQLLNVLAM